ncbi:hypothetical protein [Pseudomonas sp. GD03944]|uniref:hypothetical protein n=1 Tax=Pseudomonas sp. GD03944 TaxID=2975409 RepID=UPI00244933DA|nr:hypothetical protein [Pseudomonas sp. GD03944]MDH1265027.1 hypothetical protein [Pseudomonas sp. GD03944]
MQHVLEFPRCISCAAGFSYTLNTVDMRTPSQIAADQRAFTLGVASLAGLPISGAGLLVNYGVRPVLMGSGISSGFDALGQLIVGGEYRPGQTVIAGLTGGMVYPLAGGKLLGNALLGASVGAANAATNNYVYSESKNIGEAAAIGAFAGFAGTAAGLGMSNLAAGVLPYRIGASIIDPNKAILLQNIGVRNPYPERIGSFSDTLVGEGVPLVFDKLKNESD